MRIIAGKLGKRTFLAPRGHKTHPMSESMRGALFNTLGDIDGLGVLDAFSGSGAMSFEAISREARQSVAIEVDKSAHRVITDNIKTLNLDGQVKAIRANLAGWSKNNQDALFDVIIADPPYNDVRQSLLNILPHHLNKDGVVVVSLPKDTKITLNDMKMVKCLDHGDGQLCFYKHLT